MASRIYNVDLYFKGNPATFVIQTMEAIDTALEGEPDEPHRHNYYTLIWPFTGKGKHIIDFREYPIEPDHIFFVSPQQVHQVVVEGHPTGVVIQFTCTFLQKYGIREDFISNLRIFRNSDETPPLPVQSPMTERLRQFTGGMLDAFHSATEFRHDAIASWLKLFLIECNGHCSLHPEGNPQNEEVGRNLVKGFKELVEQHFREWHQVKEFAGALHVTPGYLNEVLRTAIGVSAKDYIQQRIVLEARRLSLFTGTSIKEIGFELGFEDPAHFSKFYKGQTGESLVSFKTGTRDEGRGTRKK